MKRMFVIPIFMLATLAWALAQQPSGTPEPNAGQTTSPSSQAPNAGQVPPGSSDQNAPQTGVPGQMTNTPITQGCLGGSNPNFTITDDAGTTYKLNIPPGADATALTPHVGESVQVMGDVKQTGGDNSIDVSRIGRGTGNCPSNSPSGRQPQPQQ